MEAGEAGASPPPSPAEGKRFQAVLLQRQPNSTVLLRKGGKGETPLPRLKIKTQTTPPNQQTKTLLKAPEPTKPLGQPARTEQGWGRTRRRCPGTHRRDPPAALSARPTSGGGGWRWPRVCPPLPGLTLLSSSIFTFFCEMLFWMRLLKLALPAARPHRSPSSRRQHSCPAPGPPAPPAAAEPAAEARASPGGAGGGGTSTAEPALLTTAAVAAAGSAPRWVTSSGAKPFMPGTTSAGGGEPGGGRRDPATHQTSPARHRGPAGRSPAPCPPPRRGGTGTQARAQGRPARPLRERLSPPAAAARTPRLPEQQQRPADRPTSSFPPCHVETLQLFPM